MEKWLYKNTALKTEDTFCYLGTIFNYNNNFLKTIKPGSDPGLKVLFALYSKCKNLSLNFETMLHMFDKLCVMPLKYGVLLVMLKLKKYI